MTFDQIWGLVKNDQRMAPQWMRVEDSPPIEEDEELPEVKIGGDPTNDDDSCCDDLKASLIALREKYRGRAAEVVFDHTLFIPEPPWDDCASMEESMNDMIDYSQHLFDDVLPEFADAIIQNYPEKYESFRQLQNDLLEVKQKFEACKATGFDDDMSHLASADPFERTWDMLMKAPLDFDSIKPTAYPSGDEESGRMMYVADFVHPTTMQRYPINISTPSLSHDFEVRVEYPPAEEGYFPEGDFFGPGDSRLDNPRDPVIGRKAAQANVHYHEDHEPNEGEYDLSFMYPPSNSIVGISPYVAAGMRGAGIGTAIYDLIQALGYRIKPSRNLSDAGEAMWRKNQGQDIEDQSEWRGMKERDE